MATGQQQPAGGHADASWPLEQPVFVNGWRTRPESQRPTVPPVAEPPTAAADSSAQLFQQLPEAMEQQAAQHATRMHQALERQAALHQQQLAEMQQLMQKAMQASQQAGSNQKPSMQGHSTMQPGLSGSQGSSAASSLEYKVVVKPLQRATAQAAENSIFRFNGSLTQVGLRDVATGAAVPTPPEDEMLARMVLRWVAGEVDQPEEIGACLHGEGMGAGLL